MCLEMPSAVEERGIHGGRRHKQKSRLVPSCRTMGTAEAPGADTV